MNNNVPESAGIQLVVNQFDLFLTSLTISITSDVPSPILIKFAASIGELYWGSVIEEYDQQKFIDSARPENEKIDLDFDVILLKPLLNLTIPLLAYSRAQTSDEKQEVLKIFKRTLIDKVK